MLTKEHLKYRLRSGKLMPIFVDVKDPQLLQQAGDLIALFEAAEGMPIGELEDAAEALLQTPVGSALTKLLLDGCDEEDDDGLVAKRRWQILQAAEGLRRASGFARLLDFQNALVRAIKEDKQRDFAQLANNLYADLPARRRVRGFVGTTPDALLARYNCAQVQGLLLQAHKVELRIKDSRLSARRELFRQLRFHRLIAEVINPGVKDRVVLRLGGPLSIFDQAATYGLRLANFFPHILHLESWELEAEVKVKAKHGTLKLDQKSGLKSHYNQRTPHIPAELTAFVSQFNEQNSGWVATQAEEFVHLGQESYCFPDLTLIKPGSGDGHDHRVHLELFHRWHAGQLLGRLEALEKMPVSSLFLGISRTLMKNPAIEQAAKRSQHFAKAGLIFSEFPTPKALKALLSANMTERA